MLDTMGLTDTQQIILIILSSFLVIFLILGVVVFVYTIKIQRSVKKVVSTIEKMTDKADKIGDIIENSAPMVSLIKLFGRFNKDKK
jgi:ATP/ADP translocase